MPKVNMSLGLTIQLQKGGHEYARPFVEISDVDTEQDVDAQIQKAVLACLKIWDAETKLVYDKVVELTDEERPELKESLATRIRLLEEKLTELAILGGHEYPEAVLFKGKKSKSKG